LKRRGEEERLTSSVLDPNGPSSNDDDGVLTVRESLLSFDEGTFGVSEGGSESSHGKGVG